MTRSQIRSFRQVLDNYIEFRRAFIQLSAKLTRAKADDLFQVILSFGSRDIGSGELTDEQIIGTLEHMDTVRCETTPPVLGPIANT